MSDSPKDVRAAIAKVIDHPRALRVAVVMFIDETGEPGISVNAEGTHSELRGLVEEGLDMVKGLIGSQRLRAAEAAERQRAPLIAVPNLSAAGRANGRTQ